MPRPSNPELERRILDAARTLWAKGGEETLSMRAVAKAAGTNTPAVYRRFRNREEILRALVRWYQQRLHEELVLCQTLPEVAERALEFALRHPREYELLMSGVLVRVTPERPNVDLVAYKCAEWFGGQPRDYEALVFAIAGFVHGVAMMKISGFFRKQDFPRARAAMLKSLQVMIANKEQFSGL